VTGSSEIAGQAAFSYTQQMVTCNKTRGSMMELPLIWKSVLSCGVIAAWWNTSALRAGEKAGRTCAGVVGFTRTPRGRCYFAAGAVQLDGAASFHVER
jgi:hypothetical protein